jgi:hypothetical protein
MAVGHLGGARLQSSFAAVRQPVERLDEKVTATCCAKHPEGLSRKGDSHLLCEAPEGPFRQKVAVTFSGHTNQHSIIPPFHYSKASQETAEPVE